VSVSDENQWVKRPPVPRLYDSELNAYPEVLEKSLTGKDKGVLHDYINLWTNNISALLDKLRDTVPGEEMIGEVHYWRDMNRILDLVAAEVKQVFVELTLQVLAISTE
jgi:hypothetical protein